MTLPFQANKVGITNPTPLPLLGGANTRACSGPLCCSN
ncbi:hypothetical protein BMETH_1566_2 [methanotrophic bacterial endosymbiont of Bathymodiolus sp.]|nr:hypothetical protein BMETH_1566_2 [methanotrophic bacterial endosymbiont of Bathymodiolus sp.]